ncbi:unnamed protein product, partial [Phaeothamnion confervicola]
RGVKWRRFSKYELVFKAPACQRPSERCSCSLQLSAERMLNSLNGVITKIRNRSRSRSKSPARASSPPRRSQDDDATLAAAIIASLENEERNAQDQALFTDAPLTDGLGKRTSGHRPRGSSSTIEDDEAFARNLQRQWSVEDKSFVLLDGCSGLNKGAGGGGGSSAAGGGGSGGGGLRPFPDNNDGRDAALAAALVAEEAENQSRLAAQRKDIIDADAALAAALAAELAENDSGRPQDPAAGQPPPTNGARRGGGGGGGGDGGGRGGNSRNGIPLCCVCHEELPVEGNQYHFVRHKFFDEMCCPWHEENTRRCCACLRFEPQQVRPPSFRLTNGHGSGKDGGVGGSWVLAAAVAAAAAAVQPPQPPALPPPPSFSLLSDGRVLCMACARTCLVDSAEAQPLFADVLSFFRKELRLPILAEMASIPVLLVDAATLNDQWHSQRAGNIGRGHGHGHGHGGDGGHGGGGEAAGLPTTRGLCLSEVGKLRHMAPGVLRFDPLTGRFVPGAPQVYELGETRDVTALLVLCGLPRDLTASILVHETLHAWIRLNPHFPSALPLQVCDREESRLDFLAGGGRALPARGLALAGACPEWRRRHRQGIEELSDRRRRRLWRLRKRKRERLQRRRRRHFRHSAAAGVAVCSGGGRPIRRAAARLFHPPDRDRRERRLRRRLQ